MGKNSFLLYDDMGGPISDLSDEEAGKLIKAVFAYRNSTNGAAFLTGGTAMAFSFIKSTLERNAMKYEETCKKNSSNAFKRWADEKGMDAVAYARMRSMQTDAKHADSESDPDSEPEKKIKKRIKKYTTENLLIDYFNEKTGKGMKYLPSSQNPIASILGLGFTEEDCKKVIDIKYSEWANDEDMKKYITIQTIFRKSHFEKYLNQNTMKHNYTVVPTGPKYQHETITEEEREEGEKLIEEAGGLDTLFKGKIKNLRKE